MGHDQRQRVLVPRLHVDEVDVHPVDLGDKLRQRVQPLRDAPEVVLVQPVTTEGLQSRELDALRAVGNELLAWPARRSNSPAQIVELLVGNVDVQGANRGGGCWVLSVHSYVLSPRISASRCGVVRVLADGSRSLDRGERVHDHVGGPGWSSRYVVGVWPFWAERAGAKNSMSSWLTRSASSWWTQCEASGRRSTRSRLGTSSWCGSASVGPR